MTQEATAVSTKNRSGAEELSDWLSGHTRLRPATQCGPSHQWEDLGDIISIFELLKNREDNWTKRLIRGQKKKYIIVTVAALNWCQDSTSRWRLFFSPSPPLEKHMVPLGRSSAPGQTSPRGSADPALSPAPSSRGVISLEAASGTASRQQEMLSAAVEPVETCLEVSGGCRMERGQRPEVRGHRELKLCKASPKQAADAETEKI